MNYKEKIVISKSDIITPLGRGIEEIWKGLLSNKTAIKKNWRFDTENIFSNMAALIPGIYLNENNSMVIQMLHILADNYRNSVKINPDYLILATTVGEIDLLEYDIERKKSENPVSSSGEQLLTKACSIFGIEDGMLISSACASSTSALIYASELIRNGTKKSVMVIGCDSVTEFVCSGFSALMALDTDAAKPFDINRKGLTVGEGAGYIIITGEKHASENLLPVWGYISGYGMTNDANHMTGPSRDGSGLSEAINKSIASSGIIENEIGFICSHGTGTVYNDLMEIKAFKKSLNGPRPTFSIKGAVGHTMGAAGLIETVISLKALKERIIPPTVGLLSPIEEAGNWVSDTSQRFTEKYALNVNAGFGGVNAAIIIRNGKDFI